MSRKDDPVFNVKFVQLVESQACLWNYTHPSYSKKEEVQKAWQHVANEIKDTVRNCRERWRTIRSSFLRSLKLARTQTGRGKRKYYLSKYLQFLIPYTKSRSCHRQNSGGASESGMVLRKPSTSTTAASFLLNAQQPMTRINHMRLLRLEHHNRGTVNADDDDGGGGEGGGDGDTTKDSQGSDIDGETELTTLPLDVQVSLHEETHNLVGQTPTNCLPLRLNAIKIEHQHQQHQHQQHNSNCSGKMVAAQPPSLVTLPVSMATAALRQNVEWTELAEWIKNSTSNNNNNNHINNNNNSGSNQAHNNMPVHASSNGNGVATPPPTACTPALGLPTAPAHLTVSHAQPPDADYSFLISLHPYLKEMNGKQNRRFRQKVVGLIDNVLDNADI